MRTNFCALAIALACLATGTAAWAADPMYTVTPLPGFARATAINNLGDIVGYTSTRKAILLRSGQLGTQEIPPLAGGATYAYGVNDNLQIVGESLVGSHMHAFLYSAGSTKDLGTLSGHNQSRATAINSKGQVVGWSQSDTVRLPFIYSRGKMTAIEAIGGLSAEATAIDDLGHVVGNAVLESYPPPTAIRPFSYSLNSFGAVGIGGLGGSNAWAFAINGNGLIVGAGEPSLTSAETHAAAWYDIFRPTDLGRLTGISNTSARGVNKAGQIVGYAYEDVATPLKAFLYLNGAMYDLNSSLATAGWSIREAIAINDNGQILAEGCKLAAMTDCAYLLLNPTTTSKPRRH